ncbi:MAG: hypothetical protein SW833_01295 [Cyanobacteriota bacterium]|nr:hypothetical protein [Cyanobacteriota bacterium]
METAAIIKLVSSAAGAIAPHLLKKAGNQLNPTEVEKAIKAGLVAAEKQEETLEPQNRLFFRSPPDFVPRFLEQFLARAGVQQELLKPLENRGEPDLAYLREEFARSHAETPQINLQLQQIEPWLGTFVKTYFEKTSTYLKFQVAKANYFRQLRQQFDNIIFAGISVPGQEDEKSGYLAEIFVMPDVVEEGQKYRDRDFILETLESLYL